MLIEIVEKDVFLPLRAPDRQLGDELLEENGAWRASVALWLEVATMLHEDAALVFRLARLVGYYNASLDPALAH